MCGGLGLVLNGRHSALIVDVIAIAGLLGLGDVAFYSEVFKMQTLFINPKMVEGIDFGKPMTTNFIAAFLEQAREFFFGIGVGELARFNEGFDIGVGERHDIFGTPVSVAGCAALESRIGVIGHPSCGAEDGTFEITNGRVFHGERFVPGFAVKA